MVLRSPKLRRLLVFFEAYGVYLGGFLFSVVCGIWNWPIVRACVLVCVLSCLLALQFAAHAGRCELPFYKPHTTRHGGFYGQRHQAHMQIATTPTEAGASDTELRCWFA
jgi:hypothetical protein